MRLDIAQVQGVVEGQIIDHTVFTLTLYTTFSITNTLVGCSSGFLIMKGLSTGGVGDDDGGVFVPAGPARRWTSWDTKPRRVPGGG